MGVADWSTNPANNATVGNINFAEGQTPSSVNNSCRQLMADIATDVWPSIAVVASATSTAAVSTLMKRDPDGRAQAISGSATLDIVNVGQLGVVAASLSAHAAATDAHSATSAATASRIVLRDANGRAAFATPSATGDAATKGYVDTAISGLVYTGSSASNTSFPVGTVLNIRLNGSIPDRNAAVTVYLSAARDYEFTMNAADSAGQLSGTWRSRGYGDDFLTVQRTA
jgi:hypothetical protein